MRVQSAMGGELKRGSVNGVISVVEGGVDQSDVRGRCR